MESTVTRERLSELLSARGVFPTPQRLDIAEVVLAKPQHLSADQIIARMRRAGSRVSKATVYNTLNLFCERGLLKTVEVDPSRLLDRKSTRLNSSHVKISYAVFCLKEK